MACPPGTNPPDQKCPRPAASRPGESEFFIDNLLVRIHCIIVMIRWTGLAPWEFEFPFPGSLTSTFLAQLKSAEQDDVGVLRG